MKQLLRTSILRTIYLLGAPGALLSAQRIRDKQPGKPRILLIRPDHLGDLVLTTPILQALRERAPNAYITMMVGPWSREVVERHPALDRLITCPFPGFRRAEQKVLAPYTLLTRTAQQLRSEDYDLAINLRPDFWWGAALIYLAGIPRRIGYALSPGMPFLTHTLPFLLPEHATVSNLRLASEGLRALDYQSLDEPYTSGRYPLFFQPTEEECQQIDTRLQLLGITQSTPIVVIHPGTGAAVKLWRSEAWAECADSLMTSYGLRVIFTGSKSEHSMLEEIAQKMVSPPILISDATVGQLAALLKRAKLVLGVDSGPLHLAVSQDTLSVRLFGPTDARIFGPWGDCARHHVIASTQRCPGCPAIPCGRLDFRPDELKAHPCVRVIEIDHIVDDAARLLKQNPQTTSKYKTSRE
jgi:ADP-heptose:LPS heptosyltransferase